jgi:glycosylphosphatidylinositol transamidase
MRLGAGLVHLTSLWALSRLRISDDKAPLAELLKALNLCVASTVITIASLLNFSLAATIALHLGVPLTLSRRWGSPSIGALMAGISGLCSLSWLLSPDRMTIAFREWTLFGNWFAPFIGVVYLPLVFQSLLVSFL